MRNKNLNYSTVEYNTVELTIVYTIDGKYYPATQFNPEEYPDVYIHEVLANDLDIIDILLESQLDDIYELLKKEL